MKKVFVYILLLATVPFASCKKFLEEKPEHFDFLSPDNFPQTEKDAELALAGALERIRVTGYYDRAFYFMAEVSGELVNSALPVQEREDFDQYSWKPDNENVVGFWNQAYSVIDGANSIIAKIPAAPKIPDEKKEWYVAAGHFLRGMAYFDLTRCYGALPLLTEPVTDPGKVLSIKRSPIADVYKLVVEDLTLASEKLPDAWPDKQPGRPVKSAAQALLARVYLTMAGAPLKDASRWAQAATAAKQVMDRGLYKLLPDFADLWKIANNNNAEILFAVQFARANGGTMMTVQSRPLNAGAETGWGFWTTTEAFMNGFSDADKRKAPSFLTSLGGKNYREFGEPQPHIGKWSDAGRPNFSDKNRRTDLAVPVIRYAEVVLTYAEAENEANGPTAGAYAAINSIRRRAGLPDVTPGLGKEQFRDTVRMERTHELAFEYNRRFDLIRWEKLQQVMGNDPASKPNFTMDKALYPVPENELSLNPNLDQNPGYTK